MSFSFESVEDVLAFIEAARAEADSQVQAWQREIAPGDHFLSYNSDFDLVIYYEVIAPDADEPPIAENTRLVRGYSVVVPKGELGLMHVANISCKLSAEKFETARKAGWPNDSAQLINPS